MKLEKKIARLKTEIQKLKNDHRQISETIYERAIRLNIIGTNETILARLQAKLELKNKIKKHSIEFLKTVHDDLEMIIKNEKLHPETRQYLEKKRSKLFVQTLRQVPVAGKLDEVGCAVEKFSRAFYASLKMAYDRTGYKPNNNTAMRFPPSVIVRPDINGLTMNYIIVDEVAELEKNGFFEKYKSLIKDQPKKRPE